MLIRSLSSLNLKGDYSYLISRQFRPIGSYFHYNPYTSYNYSSKAAVVQRSPSPIYGSTLESKKYFLSSM